MKITKLVINNVKSFKDEIEVHFDEKFNILIGPNGGGKSNLLDISTIVLRKFFLQNYKLSEGRDNNIPFTDIDINDPFRQVNKFLEKFIGNDKQSSITISFKITEGDISNIKNIKKHKTEFEEQTNKYRNKPLNNFSFCDKWDLRKLKKGKEVSYKIIDNNLEKPTNGSPEFYYYEYLRHLEYFIILSEHIETISIRPIYLYFSPNRGISHNIIEANLSNENYHDLLSNYFGSTSHSQTSLLRIAANYFAAKRRKYEGDKKKGYEEKWKNDDEVKLVTKYLGRLKYSRDLEQIDERKNIYKINLKKDHKKFTIDQASSGEKEIINFLLGIFAFNIKFGTVIIDEPELHLHPKWQTILTDLFIELSKAKETDNQFILSTHSPVFISKKTVSKTIRVYKNDENASEVISPHTEKLGSIRDLLHIVNTHNNEKLFFADKVILVEGIHDRIIYESILAHYCSDSSEIIEIVEVHSKHNLKKYRKFLKNFKIENFIIADKDYLKQVGPDKIKKLFVTDNIKIDKIIKDPKSIDRKTVISALETACKSKNIDDLARLLKYIKSRGKRLKTNLSIEEKKSIKSSIDDLKRIENILILEKGELEEYLPDGFKSLEKVHELIKPKMFNNFIKSIDKTDLKEKMKLIVKTK